MILKDTFFTIKNKSIADGKAEFRVKLNAEHFIYQAHFPNNPITPGVCLLQMVVELFDELKGVNFQMKTLKNVKFIAPISPVEFSEVDFLLEFSEDENLWQVKATVKEGETIFVKASMILA